MYANHILAEYHLYLVWKHHRHWSISQSNSITNTDTQVIRTFDIRTADNAPTLELLPKHLVQIQIPFPTNFFIFSIAAYSTSTPPSPVTVEPL